MHWYDATTHGDVEWMQPPPDSLGFADEFNLAPHAPPPTSQVGRTSIGHAAAYCALSTMVNYQRGVTDENVKRVIAYDPYHIHTLLNNPNDSIEAFNRPLSIHEALSFIEAGGAKRILDYPFLSCDHQWAQSEFEHVLNHLLASRTPEHNAIRLTSKRASRCIQKSLTEGIPVIAGFKTAHASGLGQAVCVLGYRENPDLELHVRSSTTGGSPALGDHWMTWDQFKATAKEAWALSPIDWLNGQPGESAEYTLPERPTVQYAMAYQVGPGVWYEGLTSEQTTYGSFYDELGRVFWGRFETGLPQGDFLCFEPQSWEEPVLVRYDSGKPQEDLLGFASASENERDSILRQKLMYFTSFYFE